jgi:hypothetical protein
MIKGSWAVVFLASAFVVASAASGCSDDEGGSGGAGGSGGPDGSVGSGGKAGGTGGSGGSTGGSGGSTGGSGGSTGGSGGSTGGSGGSTGGSAGASGGAAGAAGAGGECPDTFADGAPICYSCKSVMTFEACALPDFLCGIPPNINDPVPPGSSVAFFDDLYVCMCLSSVPDSGTCDTDCIDTCEGRKAPTTACLACLESSCKPQLDACLADSEGSTGG